MTNINKVTVPTSIQQTRRVLVLAIFLACIFCLEPAGANEPLSPSSFINYAANCAPQIDIHTLASVIKTESSFNRYAININGPLQLDHQPRTEDDAIEMANYLLKNGFNFDVGLGQINSKNFSKTKLSLPALFEPCQNMKAAAQILSGCYERSVHIFGKGQQALRAALSCYNTGSFRRGFQNGYVESVVANAQLIVPELFPLETDNVKATNLVVKLHQSNNQNVTSGDKEINAFNANPNENTFGAPSDNPFQSASGISGP